MQLDCDTGLGLPRRATKLAIAKRVIDDERVDRQFNENDAAEVYMTRGQLPSEPQKQPLVPKDGILQL